MSDSTKQSTTNSTASTQTGPYTPAVPGVQSLINLVNRQGINTDPTTAENDAFAGLNANAQAGNPYAPAIGGIASNLLAGGGPDRSGYATDAYSTLQNNLNPIATQSTNPYDNPAFNQLRGTLTNDITDQIKSQYAGSGYTAPATGDFAQQLGRGISQGIAPTFLQAQDTLTNQRANAANSLYGAGANTTGILSGLDQTRLGNQVQGIGASTAALNANDSPYNRLLQIAGQQRQLPLGNIGNLSSLLLPMAQLGGTANQTGTSTTNQTSNPGLLGSIGQGFQVANMGLGLLGW